MNGKWVVVACYCNAGRAVRPTVRPIFIENDWVRVYSLHDTPPTLPYLFCSMLRGKVLRDISTHADWHPTSWLLHFFSPIHFFDFLFFFWFFFFLQILQFFFSFDEKKIATTKTHMERFFNVSSSVLIPWCVLCVCVGLPGRISRPPFPHITFSPESETMNLSLKTKSKQNTNIDKWLQYSHDQ